MVNILLIYLVIGLIWMISDSVLSLFWLVTDSVLKVLLAVLDVVRNHVSSKEKLLESVKAVVLWPVMLVKHLLNK